MSTLLLSAALFFLFATFNLKSVSCAFRRIRRHQAKAKALEISKLFFYTKIQRLFFKKQEFDILFYATVSAKNIFRFAYAAAVISYVGITQIIPIVELNSWQIFFEQFTWITPLITVFFFLFCMLFIGDFLPAYFANRNPILTLRLLSLPVSIFLTICLPISYAYLRLSPLIFKRVHREHGISATELIKQKIVEIIQETDGKCILEEEHRKIIESIITFQHRVVKEIMIPRINIFSLPASTSIREATKLMGGRGFSRTPVYQDNVDQIIGVLMYKDLIKFYIDCEESANLEQLNDPIETLVKGVLYTPETKKAADLLQEFRSKQIHLAIVVDEYGGTEGIVTIEDILEEIVGDITDEYDDEVPLFKEESDGSWTVDARMSILDIEEKLDLRIPQHANYDTIGGYIFHRAGEVPSQGLIIHLNEFELEILESNERCVEKIRILPIIFPNPNDHAE